MKTIKQNELYDNVSEFLRSRGIELKEGPYAHRIRQGCTLLSEAVNTAQQGLQKAKSQVEGKVDEMRRVIHEKTAPPAAKPTAKRRTATGAAATATKGTARKKAARPAVKPKARKPKATPRPPKPVA